MTADNILIGFFMIALHFIFNVGFFLVERYTPSERSTPVERYIPLERYSPLNVSILKPVSVEPVAV